MRVIINAAFLGSETSGGGWSYTYNLVRSLHRLLHPGLEVFVVTNRSNEKKFEDLGVNVLPAPIDGVSRLQRILWEQTRLPVLARDMRADILHGPGNVLPFRTGCRTVVTIHDFQYVHFPEYFSRVRRSYLRVAVPRSVRRADWVIADSDFTRRDALNIVDSRLNRISVVHLAGFPDSETVNAGAHTLIEEGAGARSPFLLYVGSLFPHKNIRRLVDAFSELCADIPHDLVLLGESFSFGAELDRHIQQRLGPQSQRVRRLGFVSAGDLRSFYTKATALVFPSMFEGFGIPAVEAMQSGCPVIASKSTCLPEILGDAAEYFDPLDVREIATAIRAVCLNDTLRNALREKGLRRALDFSWEKTARETASIYERVAKEATVSR